MDLLNLEAYHYELPQELIAKNPAALRDTSRLMVVERSSGKMYETVFHEIEHILEKGDSLVFNDTKVIPAKLFGEKETGGRVEFLLLEEEKKGVWKALARPFRKLKVGSKIQFSTHFFCQITEKLAEGMVRIAFNDPDSFDKNLETYGAMPLPPYIQREAALDEDKVRYQTVFAKHPGAVAAPTAGLHFTEELIFRLKEKEVKEDRITLHVGLGTFKPVLATDIRLHKMHSEKYIITEETAKRLNARDKGKKQICVGTTSLRALESAASEDGKIIPGTKETEIFIYPGYRFKYADCLLTNFHLPSSTLLMLVSAFGGYELIREAYKKAVKERFRFFSYGDAMLLL